jgi:DNA-binding response OmpR family regulator
VAELLLLVGEPMVARILEHKLRREGHAVRWRRAPESRAGAAGEGFDVALVDVCVGGDGTAWMDAEGSPGAGWFAICDRCDTDAARRAVRAGAAGVVTKPFKPTAVAAQVRALLDLRRGAP